MDDKIEEILHADNHKEKNECILILYSYERNEYI
jgi:hypothetical protein